MKLCNGLVKNVYFPDESNLHHIELLDTQTDRKQQMDIADILIGNGLAEQKKHSSNSQTNEHQVLWSYLQLVLTFSNHKEGKE